MEKCSDRYSPEGQDTNRKLAGQLISSQDGRYLYMSTSLEVCQLTFPNF